MGRQGSTAELDLVTHLMQAAHLLLHCSASAGAAVSVVLAAQDAADIIIDLVGKVTTLFLLQIM